MGRKLQSVHLKLPEEPVNSYKSTQIILQDVCLLYAFICQQIWPSILLTINAFLIQTILKIFLKSHGLTIPLKCTSIHIVYIIWSKETTVLQSKLQQENTTHCSRTSCHSQTTGKDALASLLFITIFNLDNSLVRQEVLE